MFTVSLTTPALRTTLGQNFPNPFNPTTTIPFSLATDGNTRLSIYTAEGKLVRTLENGPMSKGHKRAMWDGKDAIGNPVSSGVYFFRLESNGILLTRKTVLVR
jgi:flagellar hook assembly protein FlgD